MIRAYDTCEGEYITDKVKIKVGALEIPVHTATVSKYPINRRWPGHQRPLSQTEEAYFAYIVADESFVADITYGKHFNEAVVRPLSKQVAFTTNGNTVSLSINKCGKYTVELDGLHNALHLFVEKENKNEKQGEVIYYGKGMHDVGEIELKSNQTLYIDEGAVVFARVLAEDAENVTICGNGILDGSRNKEEILFEVDRPDERGFAVNNAKRIHTVRFKYCNNIRIHNITIRDSLVYTICPVCCKNIDIDNVKIIGNWRYNSDGIDMHNCDNVRINDCFIRTYDDSICIKGFDYLMDEADMLHNGVEYKTFNNAVISNCVIWNDWGRSLEIGAETRADEISNIVFGNCDLIHNTYAACDVQNVDYADVHDITFENISVEYAPVSMSLQLQEREDEEYKLNPNDTFMPYFLCADLTYIPEYSKSATERGRIRNITFKNIHAYAPKLPPTSFKGFETKNIESITVEDVYLNGEKCDIRNSLVADNIDSLMIK